jgi:hypothetical protein
MTSKEKAIALYERFYSVKCNNTRPANLSDSQCIACAKIVAYEVMEDTPRVINKYWEDVIVELDKILK